MSQICAAYEFRGAPLYSTAYWFSERKSIGNGVRRNRIAYLARLFKNVCPSWDRDLVASELLDLLPEDFALPQLPAYDSELSFSGPDKAIGWALKYGLVPYVVVVSDVYRPGPDVESFAKTHNSEILHVRFSDFHAGLLERYRYDHEVVSRGFWCKPDQYARDSILPIPEAWRWES